MACVSGTGKPLGSSPAFTRTFWSLSGGHHGRAVIMLTAPHALQKSEPHPTWGEEKIKGVARLVTPA